ncbi:MAG: sigma-70 family RNA polymerase sigma factor [Clostridia bacterium]|nr:sigma-70 family RNA polymerase sigma factor [Clostridia bacterium]
MDARNGDSSAVEQIMTECYQEVYYTACLTINNETDAQDITQEVFIKLFNIIHTMKQPDSFHAWLRKITINESLMFLRKNHGKTYSIDDFDNSEEILTTDDGEYTEILPSEKCDKLENDKIIYDLVNELPEKYKTVVLMRYYSDMPYADIAEQLGLNIGTVKSRLSYSKNLLNGKIELFEKKHGIRLHTTDIFDNLGDIISSAANSMDAPSGLLDKLTADMSSYTNTSAPAGSLNSAVNEAHNLTEIAKSGSTAANMAQAGVTNSFSAAISNALSTKISAATAAVSIAACLGLVSFNVSFANMPEIPAEPSAAESSVTEETQTESSEEESSEVSEKSEESEESSDTSEESETVESSITDESSTADESSAVEESSEVSETSTEQSSVPSAASVTTATASATKDYGSYATVTTDGGKYKFRLYYNSNEAIMLEYNGTETNVVLPSYVQYNGMNIPITRINKDLFKNYRYQYYSVVSEGTATTVSPAEPEIKITSIRFPDHLTEIPDTLCCEMHYLTSISGGQDVTKIGLSAFNRTGLTELNFPELFPNLLEIGSQAFMYCNNLQKVVMPQNYIYADTTTFDLDIKDITFTYDYDLNKYYPNTKKNMHIVLPGDKIQVKNVLYTSFYSDDLSTDEIDANYEKIQFENLYLELENQGAVFSDRLGNLIAKMEISDLYFPEGMKEITFYDLVSQSTSATPTITNLHIPASVTNIDEQAFAWTSNGTQTPVTIENIILPKARKDSATLQKLKESITKSGNFQFDHDDGNYLYFTNKNFLV